jgi:hypothetical protein
MSLDKLRCTLVLVYWEGAFLIWGPRTAAPLAPLQDRPCKYHVLPKKPYGGHELCYTSTGTGIRYDTYRIRTFSK